MKRIVLIYGLIGGVVVSTLMLLNISIMGCGWEYGMLAGYTTMVIALGPIFFAVKAYRDRQLGRSIGFGKAFVLGLYITLVASTLYVASWMVYSSTMQPDYMEQYIAQTEEKMRGEGKPEAEVAAELKEQRDFAEAYKNPVVKIGYTYLEILPVGLLISLLCAAILKRRTPVGDARALVVALLMVGATQASLAQRSVPLPQDTAMNKSEPKVTGIGGIFFASEDPAQTCRWYGEHLGLAIDAYGSPFEFRNANRPDEINYLRWSAFRRGAEYFKPSKNDFMINYRVQHIEALVEQLKATGVNVLDTIAAYDYGKFVHLLDGDGNKVELWEPVDSVFTRMGGPTTK